MNILARFKPTFSKLIRKQTIKQKRIFKYKVPLNNDVFGKYYMRTGYLWKNGIEISIINVQLNMSRVFVLGCGIVHYSLK